MKPIKNILYLMLLVLTFGCLKGGKGEIPNGFLGIGKEKSFSLEDDVPNKLLWKSAIEETVIGNVLSPSIPGTCVDVKQVELWLNGSLKKTVSCVSDKFIVSLSGSDALTNGIHSFQFKTIPASITIDRTYDVLYVDPSTLVTLSTVPTTSINSSINYSLSCHNDLTLSIAGVSLDCSSGEIMTQNIPLIIGTNIFTVTWIDSHNNSGSQTFSLTRNPPGAPEVLAGMVSAISSSTISLSNCSGGCDGTTVSNVAVYGFGSGVTNQGIPLSRAPASGGGGETISLGNQSYIFCEHQNISGECIP